VNATSSPECRRYQNEPNLPRWRTHGRLFQKKSTGFCTPGSQTTPGNRLLSAREYIHLHAYFRSSCGPLPATGPAPKYIQNSTSYAQVVVTVTVVDNFYEGGIEKNRPYIFLNLRLGTPTAPMTVRLILPEPRAFYCCLNLNERTRLR
jgi:hypothetical protein